MRAKIGVISVSWRVYIVNPVYQFWAQKRTQLTIWNPAQGSRGMIGLGRNRAGCKCTLKRLSISAATKRFPLHMLSTTTESNASAAPPSLLSDQRQTSFLEIL